MSTEESDRTNTIITISELIESAFGDPESNTVHHKHIQAVLYILARQLRILERRVAVQLKPTQVQQSSSSLSVTEVKLAAITESKKGSKQSQPKKKGQIISEKGTSTSDEQSSTVVKTTTLEESDNEPSTRDKSSRSAKKTMAGKTTSIDDDTSTTGTIRDKTSRSTKKATTGKLTSVDDDTSTTGKFLAVNDGSSSDRRLSDVTSRNLRPRQKTMDSSMSADTISLDPQGYQSLLDKVEQMRERELRVIHQRADSRDQRDKTPTPIASMDSFEATYEKLLVVERVPSEEAKARAARGTKHESAPRLSVVTQEQFAELVKTVRHLQQKLAPVGFAELPENAELLQELRKGASLTDAMAALQLSARLEATEKTLTNLLSLVTDLAQQTPGFESVKEDNIEVLFGASGEKRPEKIKISSKKAKSAKPSTTTSQKESEIMDTDLSPIDSLENIVPTEPPRDNGDVDIATNGDIITPEQLQNALEELYDDIVKQVNEKSTQSNASADTAMKMVLKLEKKIDVSLNLRNRMEALESLVSTYSEQINILDTSLSSQLTNYQEELTQMQHDLETGLETMAEVLANTGGDATAVAELNAHFTDLQSEIDDAGQRQKELRYIQNSLSLNLDALKVNIEMLRDTKSDRDEVVDALRDKAGLKDLNGLISREQYEACRGDLEKRIANAYEKFNNQENVWQKAIDDIIRQLNEKADTVQVYGLRDSITYYLEEMKKKIDFIINIVGEPVAVAVAKHLSRDTACLSCASPALMKPETNTIPVLPAMRPPTIGAETPKPKEDGDHGPCYPGYPIKHAIDPRAHICNRWCGGSHTVTANTTKSRVPPGVIITPFIRKVGQESGTDGKMYAVEELMPRKPCLQCLDPDPPEASKHGVGLSEDTPFNMNPIDFVSISSAVHDVTPPINDFDM